MFKDAATLASYGPFSALYFVFYERLKGAARERLSKHEGRVPETGDRDDGDSDLPLPYLVACSASAGAAASWLTSPLDMAKLRLQVQRGGAAAGSGAGADGGIGNAAYRGMADCLRRAYAAGGVRGLFRGAGARVLHFTPSTCITMTSYETCRSFYAQALSSS